MNIYILYIKGRIHLYQIAYYFCDYMNKFGRVVIGFGNRYGQTNEAVISEEISRLELTNLKATVGTNPSISIKESPDFDMGAL